MICYHGAPMKDVMLIVDDEEDIHDSLHMAFAGDYEVLLASSAEEALSICKVNTPDVVLLDICLPGMNGIECLKAMRSAFGYDSAVIMITAREDVSTVVEAMKEGAFDYIVKPINLTSLELVLERALETVRLRKEVAALKKSRLDEINVTLIGESHSLEAIVDLVDKVGKSPDTPVLIVGESGTGKDVVAQLVHYRSVNFAMPFISINCGAITPELAESELFGHEPGAFTGAREKGKEGLVEQARGGTLFLDEVVELPLSTQVKLLKFLEDKSFYRVGGTKKIEVQTRIIAACNSNIEEEVKEGRFRQDLYYRLNVVKIELPPLRERPDDIIPLAKYFLDLFNRKLGKRFFGISREAEMGLKQYHWPGNVRELRNIFERIALLEEGPYVETAYLRTIRSKAEGSPAVPFARKTDLDSKPLLPDDGVDLDRLIVNLMREAIKRHPDNMAAAARLLKLDPRIFRYKAKKLGLDKDEI